MNLMNMCFGRQLKICELLNTINKKNIEIKKYILLVNSQFTN